MLAYDLLESHTGRRRSIVSSNAGGELPAEAGDPGRDATAAEQIAAGSQSGSGMDFV